MVSNSYMHAYYIPIRFNGRTILKVSLSSRSHMISIDINQNTCFCLTYQLMSTYCMSSLNQTSNVSHTKVVVVFLNVHFFVIEVNLKPPCQRQTNIIQLSTLKQKTIWLQNPRLNFLCQFRFNDESFSLCHNVYLHMCRTASRQCTVCATHVLHMRNMCMLVHRAKAAIIKQFLNSSEIHQK